MDNNLAKLLARLTALKNNLPENSVSRKYVDEFNSITVGLEEISNETLKEFKISESEIKPRLLSWNYLTGGEKKYSSEHYCQKEYLLMKIDGVLGYFTLLLQPTETKEKLGFDIEEK